MPWDAIVNGLFAIVVAVLVGRLNGKVKRVASDAKATRSQVENNHDTNLREEGDERHAENSDKLDTLTRLVTGLTDDMGRVRTSLSRVWLRLDGHTDAIHELELTSPGSSRFAPPIPPRHRKENHE